MKNKGMSEAEVLSWTLEILRSRDIYCWRQNTGAFKTENRFLEAQELEFLISWVFYRMEGF